jgi:hypothetical protein
MGAYVMWMAGHSEELQKRLQTRVLELRSQGYGRTAHARLPAALSELQAGWEIFMQFALEAGAIDRAQGKELERRNRSALEELCVRQAKYQETNDPALRFVSLLQAALECGRAHLAIAKVERRKILSCGDGNANRAAGDGCPRGPKSVGL